MSIIDRSYKDAKLAAKDIGIAEAIMVELLKKGELPGIELAGTWLVSEVGLAKFLQEEENRQFTARRRSRPVPGQGRRSRSRVAETTVVTEFTVLGKRLAAPTKVAVLERVLRELSRNDPEFLRRFSKVGGRTRRYVSDVRSLLYSGKGLDFARKYSKELEPGWWFSTNHNSRTIDMILEKACRTAGLRWGVDVALSPQMKSVDRLKALAFVGAARDTASDVARRHDDYLTE